jgi:hypothetical protein
MLPECDTDLPYSQISIFKGVQGPFICPHPGLSS